VFVILYRFAFDIMLDAAKAALLEALRVKLKAQLEVVEVG
jgi:hypothetical protein